VGLPDVDRGMGLYKEGIQLALETFEQLGDTVEQAYCLKYLARLLYDNKHIDAAEEARIPRNGSHPRERPTISSL